MQRRHFNLLLPVAASLAGLPSWAKPGKATLSLGMGLEPPGLDPTSGAAAAIGEVVLYNIFETLTKIEPDGSVTPLLAQRWDIDDDLRHFTFHLRKDAKFSNDQSFDANSVKFSFERAADDKSTNKDKSIFSAIENIDIVDSSTVKITIAQPDPDFLFRLGQPTAIMVEASSADNNNQQPVGTGPYVLDRWSKGSSIRLKARPDWRHADQIAIQQATFRFISEPAAQIAAVLSGDIDVFARVNSRGRAQFKRSKQLQTITSGSRAKTVLAINNARQPLDDVRVRRAIAMAIDREAVIAAAGDGLGVPIGSHYVPGMPGYVDTTGVNPYDPERAKALLAEAGVVTPLKLELVLPPPSYARQGAEVIMAQLAKIGIQTKAQNVEWAQWLANTYGGAHNYDLTIISHVEPLDLDNFVNPDYYWGYHSDAFNALYDKILHAADPAARAKLLGEAQQMLASDAVLAWLYQPQWLSVANRQVEGLWTDMPISVNDLSALRWR